MRIAIIIRISRIQSDLFFYKMEPQQFKKRESDMNCYYCLTRDYLKLLFCFCKYSSFRNHEYYRLLRVERCKRGINLSTDAPAPWCVKI